jgi:hypothetical protein
MPTEIRPLASRKDLRRFIYLPAQIHRNHDKWLPPIYADQWHFFDKKKNPAFSHCDTTLVVAYRDGAPVGRIMGIINKRHNELRNERTARFWYLDSFEDREVADALLGYVEDWARNHGMNKLVGPMGFTDQDPLGFLVEGLEEEPTIVSNYNFPYIVRFLEARGYEKEVDYVVYKVKVPEETPEIYDRIAKRLSKQRGILLREFTRRKEVKPYAHDVFRLVNETFHNLYGYVPLDEKEMDTLVKRYLPMLDPRFAKLITKDDQVIAFVVGIPHMNEGIRKSKGHLFPFGIFHIIRSARKAKQLDLLLGAIKQEFRGLGLDVLLGAAMMRSARAARFECMDSSHELETNTRMRAEMERVGGQVYKRYRIFRKEL